MRKCPKCKRTIDNDKAKFCKYCGEPLGVVAASHGVAQSAGSGGAKPLSRANAGRSQSPGITLDIPVPKPQPTLQPKPQPQPASPSFSRPASDVRPSWQDANPGRRMRRMSFTGAVRSCFRNYATFSGRASRPEFWYFYLFSVIIQILLFIALMVLAACDAPDSVGVPFMVLWTVWQLAMILPTLAVTIRRLHDTGRSGANVLLGFIPIVGPILMLIYLVAESDINSNRFGHPQP